MNTPETILYEPRSHESIFQKNLMLGMGFILITLGAIYKEYIAGIIGVCSTVLGFRPLKDKRKIWIKEGRLHYRFGWRSEKQFRLEDVEGMKIVFASREGQYRSISIQRYYCFELNSREKVYLPNVLTSDNESILMDLFKDKFIEGS
jgi:hypothetical protein